MRKLLRRILSIILSSCLLCTCTTSAFAVHIGATTLSDSAIYDLLLSGFQAGSSIEALEEYLGNEIIFDPAEYDAANYNSEWIQDAQSFVTTTMARNAVFLEEDPIVIENQAKATSIAYAMDCADWSIRKGRGTDYANEAAYMFLSHYVDRPDYYWGSSNISLLLDGPSMSEGPQFFAKWITDMDRDVYRTYMVQGNISSAMRGFVSVVANTKTLLENNQLLTQVKQDMDFMSSTLRGAKVSFTALESGLAGAELAEDVIFAIRFLLNSIRQNPQEKVSLLYEQTIGNSNIFKDYDGTIRDTLLRICISVASGFLIGGVVGGAGGLVVSALKGSMIGFTLDSFMGLFDLVYWTTMRYSFHGRQAGRYYDYLMGGY